MKWVVWDEYSVAVCVDRGKKTRGLGLWQPKSQEASEA